MSGLPGGSILAAILDIQRGNVLTDQQALQILEKLLQAGHSIDKLQGESFNYVPYQIAVPMVTRYIRYLTL